MGVDTVIDRARPSGGAPYRFSDAELAASLAELDDDDVASVVDRLLHTPDRRDLRLARVLARREIESRRRASDGCGDTLYGLCFLLYLVGEAEDVLLVDEAKHINFDAGCMIDGDLYQMRRGRAEMVAAVATLLADPATRTAHAMLEDGVINAFDRPTNESVDAFENVLRRYFGVE